MIFKKINIFILLLTLAGFALFPGSILANNFLNYSILAQNSVHIKKKAAILSGFVGVNEPSTVLTPEDEGVQLLVDKEVLFEEETRLVAPSILIKRESTIHGDIDYQDRLTIQDKVTVTGDVNILNGPADWPLVSFPAPPGCTPDLTNAFMVKEGSQSHMPPGHYGDVSIGRNATVTFDGGEYHFSSFRIDKEAKVYFSSPATICIANSFQTGSDVFFGPKNDDTTLSGADIRFYVNGVDFPEAEGDGHSGEEQELEAVAKIGKKNVFFGQVFALNGTLEIENAVQANGAYIARDIVVGKNSVITRNTSPAPVDTTPPVIIGINPAEGSVLNDPTPTFSANFQDADSGINPASVQILLDGQDVTLQADVSEMGFSFIPAALTDGPHVLSIRVDDNAGNNTQSTVNFTINTDVTPPQILNVLPVDGSLLAGTPPQISADFYDDTAVDASSVRILLDNVDITAQSSVTATGFNILVTAVLNDGSHTLLISVRDTAGNLAQVSTNFKIDTLPPDIAISVPADGSLLATVTPTISGNFSDAIAGIDENSVRIFVDGVNLTSQATITQTAFTAPVTDTLNDGAHTITVEAADSAGNAAVQTSIFTIDTIAPVISNLTPAHMSTITANLPLISASFADSGSGVDILSAQILVDNINVTPQATIAETGFNYTPSVPLNNGYHTVVVTVADVADNITQAVYSFNVLLDQAPPTIFNIIPAAGNLLASSTPTLSASFEDNLTGVAPLSAQILLDGTDVTAQADVTASGFSFVPSPLGDGGHTLSISIRDNQGNAAQASVHFTTDTAAPVISNITPADGATIAVDTPTISADFSDTISGIDISSVQILVDGNNRTAQAVVTEGGFDLTLGSPLANGSHTVDIRVADIAGNTTQIHSGFTVFIHEPTQVSGTISQNTTWTLAQSPYLVAGNITVNGGVTLTIEAGVVVKFNGFYFIDGQGVIHAQGTSGNRITFTSNKTTPAVGDWNNITIRDANSILDYVTIEYADRGVYVPSYASNPATIQNNLIQHNNNGIYFEPGTGPSILSNTIVNNNVGIFAGCNGFTGCSPVTNDNDIYNNAHYNLTAYSYGSNASGIIINAENNWWGSADAVAVENTIYHNTDDASLAVVDYEPFRVVEVGKTIDITNHAVTQRFFDPRRTETTSITYSLGTDSDVTIGVYDYPSRNLVRTLVNNQPRLAGANTETWDGTDNNSQGLPPGLYIYTIVAQTADGMLGRYDPVFAGGPAPNPLNVSVAPTGAFSPFKGERLEVRYDLDAPALVTLKYLDTAILRDRPRNVSGNLDVWDGRGTSGDILVSDQFVQIKLYTKPLPENVLVLEHRTDLDIAALTTNPYVIRPLYSQVTQILYTINETADVTVKILTSDATTVVAALEQTPGKSVGTYTLQWDGRADSDGGIVAEGDYRVRVEAVDSFGESVVRDGNIRILF